MKKNIHKAFAESLRREIKEANAKLFGGPLEHAATVARQATGSGMMKGIKPIARGALASGVAKYGGIAAKASKKIGEASNPYTEKAEQDYLKKKGLSPKPTNVSQQPHTVNPDNEAAYQDYLNRKAKKPVKEGLRRGTQKTSSQRALGRTGGVYRGVTNLRNKLGA